MFCQVINTPVRPNPRIHEVPFKYRESSNDICDCFYGTSNTDSIEKNISKKKLPRKLWNYLKEMKYINGGCTGINAENRLSPTDKDTALLFFNHDKKISTNSFLLDEKEVTNKEYKEFVNWVKDSIVRTFIAEKNPIYYSDKKNKILNWEIPIDRSDSSILKTFYFDIKKRFYKRRFEFDSNKIIYKYFDGNNEIQINIYPDTLKWESEFTYSYNEPMTNMYFWHPAYDCYPVVGVNYNQAKAYCHWKTEQLKNKLKQFNELKNFSISYRLPTEIEWEYAALARIAGHYKYGDCLDYPWNGEGIISNKNKYYANYGTTTNENGLLVKSYNDDGFFHTNFAGAFSGNDFGLYDMAGNVAEWTEDKPCEMSLKNYFDCYPFRDTLFYDVNTSISDSDDVHSILKKIVNIQNENVIYYHNIDTIFNIGRERIINDAQNMLHDYKVLKKTANPRIVKGGSWADPLTYLLVCMNQVYPEDYGSCKIGFRLAMSVPTELIPYFYTDKYFKDQEKKNKKESKQRIKNRKRKKNY